jgi:hypothetical protein
MSAYGKNTGGRMSATVTGNDAVELLPRGSKAVHWTVVVVIANSVLGACWHET